MRESTGQSRVVVLRKDGLTWSEVALPALFPVETSWINRVACLPNGGMVASGAVHDKEGTIKEGFLLRYDGTWTRIPFPQPFRDYSADTLTAAAQDDTWVQVSSFSGDPMFLRWTNGHWSSVPYPTLPAGGSSLLPISLHRIQFVSPEEAWAVGTKLYGGGYFHGVIFHYKDGIWKNRNWNWHSWNERWFGLFGQ